MLRDGAEKLKRSSAADEWKATQEGRAAYIGKLASELSLMAHQVDLSVLAHLLAMAAMAANEKTE